MNNALRFHRILRWTRLPVLLTGLLLHTLPAHAQSSISFKFANVQTTLYGLSFDVVAVAGKAGTRLGDTQIYLDYNDAAFGTLAHSNSRLTATLGPDLAAGGHYGAPLLNDQGPTRASLVAEFLGAPDQGFALSDAPAVLFRVTMQAARQGETARVRFYEPLMEGQQFTSDLATPFTDVLTLGLVDITLPLQVQPVLTVASAHQGTVELAWAEADRAAGTRFELEQAAGPAGLFKQVGLVEGRSAAPDGQAYAYRIEGLDLGLHRFRLRQIGASGSVTYSEEVEVQVEMTEDFRLEPAYPNPFNPAATIRFAVKTSGPVHMLLYNTAGQQVKRLYEGTPPANQYETVRIDGSDLASGLYFVRLQGESFTGLQRILLLK